MSTLESQPSSKCVDEIDEYKCQSCGQVPICLNSTTNGHEVCDDCMSLFKVDMDTVCPLSTCKLPSHMANKIKDDLEKSKCSDENAIKEVNGQLMSLKQNFDELATNVSKMKSNVKDFETEVSKDMQEVKLEILKEMQMDREAKGDLQLKVETLMTKFSSIDNESKGLKKKMNEQSEEYKNLKMENEELIAENMDLKGDLKKVEDKLEVFRSSVTLNSHQLKEKMFLMDYSLSHLDSSLMNAFNLITQCDQFQPALTWKIKGIKVKMEQKMFKEWSHLFNWTGYLVKARAKLVLKDDDDCFHMSMCLENASNVANEKHVKFPPVVYFLLKNQNSDKLSQHKMAQQYYVFSNKLKNLDKYSKVLAHKSWFTDKSFNVDDAVIVEIFMRTPPQLDQQVYSRVGVLNWVMKDYEKRQLLHDKKLINYEESPYFYTAPRGYRVQVLLVLNGLEEYKGKGPSAYIIFLVGENDQDLTNSFPHRTTITLHNPKNPGCSVVKTIHANINVKKFYRVDLCEKSALTNFIKDDTLYIRVNITQTS